MDFVFLILGMIVLLLLQGFFSGSEIALVHSDKLRLHHRANQGNRGAALVLKLFTKPEVLLGTTLVGTNLSVVGLTTLGTLLMIRFFGEVGELYAIIIYTPIFLVLGEVVPKSIYQQISNDLAPKIIYPLRACSWLFFPIVFLFSRIARVVARLVGVPPETEAFLVSREKIRSVVEMAEQGANVDVFDRDRIMRVVRFAERTAEHAMIPIEDMALLSKDATTQEAVSLARSRGYFRLPVYQEKTTNINGAATFTMWDLMDPTFSQTPLQDLIHPVHYVSPDQLLDEIFPILQHRKDHMAIVVDEFGSAIGMVTLEDIIEEITGEVINVGFNFEAYVPRKRFEAQQTEEGAYLMNGRMPLSDAAELLKTRLPTHMAHTVGGMVTAMLRHIPVSGESILVGGYRFEVVAASQKSIEQLRVEAIGR